jgi:hypothetical protein
MGYLTRNRDKKTYYSVGWNVLGSSSAVFRDVSIPGAVFRVMDKCAHQAALERAGKKLRELSRASGRKEFSL